MWVVLPSDYTPKGWVQSRLVLQGAGVMEGFGIRTGIRSHSQNQNRLGSETIAWDRVSHGLTRFRSKKPKAKNQTRIEGWKSEAGNAMGLTIVSSQSQSQESEPGTQQGSIWKVRSKNFGLCLDRKTIDWAWLLRVGGIGGLVFLASGGWLPWMLHSAHLEPRHGSRFAVGGTCSGDNLPWSPDWDQLGPGF